MNDAELDALLKADAAQDLADDGFTPRLLLRLPRRRLQRNAMPARAAQLMAMSLAVLALSWLPASAEALLPASCLLALVLWWSLPQSGGALFRAA